MADTPDHLGDLLTDGWVVVGYSTAMMAVGGMVHSVLLQRESDLVSVSIIKTGAKEIGRTVDILAPKALEKGGWF